MDGRETETARNCSKSCEGGDIMRVPRFVIAASIELSLVQVRGEARRSSGSGFELLQVGADPARCCVCALLLLVINRTQFTIGDACDAQRCYVLYCAVLYGSYEKRTRLTQRVVSVPLLWNWCARFVIRDS